MKSFLHTDGAMCLCSNICMDSLHCMIFEGGGGGRMNFGGLGHQRDDGLLFRLRKKSSWNQSSIKYRNKLHWKAKSKCQTFVLQQAVIKGQNTIPNIYFAFQTCALHPGFCLQRLFFAFGIWIEVFLTSPFPFLNSWLCS